jgi:capsular polysaccharide transport system permease protein
LWWAGDMHLGSAIPIVAFAVTGYSSVLMWRNTVGRCNSGIQQNRQLLYHRPVKPIDVFITRIVLEMAGATASFLVLSMFFIGTGGMGPPEDVGLVVVGWLMLAWFGAALALLIGAATVFSEIVERLWHPISYLLFPLSGAAFMVEWLPQKAQTAALLLPMVHGVEILREGYFGGAVRTHYDISYMLACNLVLTFAGLSVMRVAARRAGAT